MRRLSLAFLATAALGAGFSQIASAAAYNWSGFYLGATAGYGWGDSKHCDDGTCSIPGAVYPEPSMDGWNGGATLGFNWQAVNWVAGAEADWSWGKISGASRDTATFGCGGGTQTCNTDVNSVGTVRGRAGYAFDRVLPYLTAGVAFSRLHASNGVGSSTSVTSQSTTTKSSFVWGAGVEFALAPQWSAKIEYLHTDLGDFDYDVRPSCVPPAPGCSVNDVSLNLVRFGVNYRFAGGR